MRHTPRQRGPRLGDIVPKLAIAGVVLGLVFWRVSAYRAAGALESARVQQQVLDEDAARHRAEGERIGALRASVSASAAPTSQSAIHRCTADDGTTILQSWPCEGSQQANALRPGEVREAEESRQRAARLARQEAQIALYTRAYSAAPAPATDTGTATPAAPAPAPAAPPLGTRCEQAKRYRDDVYRRVGNNRTFDLIRNLDDQVYDACKGG